MKKKIFGVLFLACSVPAFSQFGFPTCGTTPLNPCFNWDPHTMAQVMQDIRQAEQLFQLEQMTQMMIRNASAMFKNPGMFFSALNMSIQAANQVAMQTGAYKNLDPDTLNNIKRGIQLAQVTGTLAGGGMGVGGVSSANGALVAIMQMQQATQMQSQAKLEQQIQTNTELQNYGASASSYSFNSLSASSTRVPQ